jgi:hypothetical protein
MLPTLRSIVLEVLVAVVLFLGCLSAYAQDTLAQIAKHQERIEKLENDFSVSQRRLLAQTNMSSAQDLTYDQVTSVGELLSTANREFGVLSQSPILASLVTEKRALPLAKRIVDAQKEYMVKRMRSATEFTERTLARAKDQETSRLLLEARDMLKASTEFIESLLPKTEK